MGEGFLLNLILEVSEYCVEDFISGQGVVIEVVVFRCLFMYVEALNCVKVGAFFVEMYYTHDVLMFPRVCECSSRCCAYLEDWLLCIKERLCSLNLVLKSQPV
jgi:hypothetical protein